MPVVQTSGFHPSSGNRECDGERGAVDEGGASGELCAAHCGEQGCGGDVDAGVDEGGADAFGENFDQVGGLGTDGGAEASRWTSSITTSWMPAAV